MYIIICTRNSSSCARQLHVKCYGGDGQVGNMWRRLIRLPTATHHRVSRVRLDSNTTAVGPSNSHGTITTRQPETPLASMESTTLALSHQMPWSLSRPQSGSGWPNHRPHVIMPWSMEMDLVPPLELSMGASSVEATLRTWLGNNTASNSTSLIALPWV